MSAALCPSESKASPTEATTSEEGPAEDAAGARAFAVDVGRLAGGAMAFLGASLPYPPLVTVSEAVEPPDVCAGQT